jgi:cation transport protein ChaC
MHLTPELVAGTVRKVPDEGPEPGWTPLPDHELDLLTKRIAREAGTDPIWVFAYGSLIWNPGFEVAGRERATAYGWHRAFSLRMERCRATSEQPGLMMALEAGGRCKGLNLRLLDEHRLQDLRTLLQREIRYREVVDMVRWLRVRTPNGSRRALTFWAGVKGDRSASGLPLPEVAIMLARACGPAGSCAEYLHNTVAHLEAEGIRDRNLWRLQALVAEDLRQRRVE